MKIENRKMGLAESYALAVGEARKARFRRHREVRKKMVKVAKKETTVCAFMRSYFNDLVGNY